MSTTQLFVELLVIGLGAGVWVSLLADVVSGGQIRLLEVWSEKLFVLPLIAAAYSLGVVLDRLVWSIFAPVERTYERKYLLSSGVPRWYLERSVMNGSEALARDLYYNRSRLRICRAWVANASLITLSFVLWGELKHRLSHGQSIVVGLSGAAFVACSLWALRQFMKDYYRNLRSSYRFLQRSPATPASSAVPIPPPAAGARWD